MAAGKSYFSPRALKHFPELLPLTTAIGFGCLMGTGMIAYALYFKSDVVLNKKNPIPLHERVNPEQKQKLLVFKEKYQKEKPELVALRKEISAAYNEK